VKWTLVFTQIEVLIGNNDVVFAEEQGAVAKSRSRIDRALPPFLPLLFTVAGIEGIRPPVVAEEGIRPSVAVEDILPSVVVVVEPVRRKEVHRWP